MTTEELRRAAKFMVHIDEPPKVPENLRSTGTAAIEADIQCLKKLSKNRVIRVASWNLARNSSLGK